jgi:sulfur-carrier protein
MGVRVVMLGRLRDLGGTEELILHAPLSWEALLAGVPDLLAEAIRHEGVHVALSGTVLPDKATLLAQDGDEVALLPPVSGG